MYDIYSYLPPQKDSFLQYLLHIDMFIGDDVFLK